MSLDIKNFAAYCVALFMMLNEKSDGPNAKWDASSFSINSGCFGTPSVSTYLRYAGDHWMSNFFVRADPVVKITQGAFPDGLNESQGSGFTFKLPQFVFYPTDGEQAGLEMKIVTVESTEKTQVVNDEFGEPYLLGNEWFTAPKQANGGPEIKMFKIYVTVGPASFLSDVMTLAKCNSGQLSNTVLASQSWTTEQTFTKFKKSCGKNKVCSTNKAFQETEFFFFDKFKSADGICSNPMTYTIHKNEVGLT